MSESFVESSHSIPDVCWRTRERRDFPNNKQAATTEGHPLVRSYELLTWRLTCSNKHESLFVLSLNLFLYLSLKLSLARLDSRNVKAWLEKLCLEISCTVTEIVTYLAGERKRFYPSLPSYKNIHLNQKFKFKILRETRNIRPTINKYLFTSVRVEIIEDFLEADMRPDRLLLANDWRL